MEEVTRHIPDPLTMDKGLCGKVPDDPVEFFRLEPTDKPGLCRTCALFAEDMVNLYAGMSGAIPKDSPRNRNRNRNRLTAVGTRRLRVRPDRQHMGVIDVEEMRRMASLEPCGGGWRK